MNLLKKIFSLVVVCILVGFLSNDVEAKPKAKKDCVSCTQEEVTGAPMKGDKSLEKFVDVLMYSDPSTLGYYIKTYCLGFVQLQSLYEFKKEMTKSMQETKFTVDQYWQFAGCRPDDIGGTLSPIIHLAVEVPSDRLKFVKALYNYYHNERKDDELWIKAINAQSTRGHTLLDYVVYLKERGKILDSEKEPLNEILTFVCENGGKFNNYKNMSCPFKIE